MIAAFKKLIEHWFGVHLCNEFTRWETKEIAYSRPRAYLTDPIPRDPNITTVEWIEKFQERQCTLCGKIQQKNLKW